MKLSVFAILVGVCLVISAQVNAESIESSDEDISDDLQYTMEEDEFGGVFTFWGFKHVLKKALRTLKGVNCSIKAVLNVRRAAQQFIDDVAACEGQVVKEVQNVINSCNDIINTCNDILNYHENICNGGGDENSKTSKNCTVQLTKKIYSLKKKTEKTVKQIKKIPKKGANASECINNAANALSSSFTQFPGFVKECSKLTH